MKKLMFGFFVLLGSAAGVYAQDSTSMKSTTAYTTPTTQPAQDKDKYDDKEAIAVSELPQKVQASIQGKDYTGWNVSKAYKKVKDGKTFYAVELMNGSERKMVKFDAQGNKIKEKDKM